MWGIAAFGISLYVLAAIYTPPADANFVEIDTWGQQYCRHSYCSLLDADGWSKCCRMYKTCCAYAEYTNGEAYDPFSFEIHVARRPITNPPPTTTTTTTTTTTLPPTRPVPVTEDLGGPLEEHPSAPDASASLPGGRPESLRLQSPPPRKPIPGELSGYGAIPGRPSKNDVTYKLPPVSPDVEEMRQEEFERESCRPKFCALMSVSQWYNCCSRFKHCCAYVSYLNYQDPFHFDKGPNDS